MRDAGPSACKCADTTPLSRTALSIPRAVLTTITLNLRVDGPLGKSIRASRFGCSLHLLERRGVGSEILQIFLNAHDHSLRFASPAYNETLVILSHPFKNLAKLRTGRKSRNDVRYFLRSHGFGFARSIDSN